MEGILVFDPTSEFELLETIDDFQEQITRPEELRFFTLDEQLQDFFEKSLPQGKPTSYQLKELRYDRDRIRKAYSKLITITDTDYFLNLHRTSLNVDWILPSYSEFKYKPYSFDKEYNPLFSQASLKQSNYYPRLIDALPKPFNSTGEGLQITKNELLVNKDGINDAMIGTNIENQLFLNDGKGTVLTNKITVDRKSTRLNSSHFVGNN
jgi:hypothetical protein